MAAERISTMTISRRWYHQRRCAIAASRCEDIDNVRLQEKLWKQRRER
jgi:hypothetical protein